MADLSGLCREEVAYRMALAVAASSRMGFRLRDCGKGNWGFAMRSVRIVPLVLDGNSWHRLEPEDSGTADGQINVSLAPSIERDT